eukprot:8811840-Pyramimonas_sp.AAC.1
MPTSAMFVQFLLYGFWHARLFGLSKLQAGPKGPPRPPQDGPRGSQERPKAVQEGPKTAQETPKTAQEGPQTAPGVTRDGGPEPQWPPVG